MANPLINSGDAVLVVYSNIFLYLCNVTNKERSTKID